MKQRIIRSLSTAILAAACLGGNLVNAESLPTIPTTVERVGENLSTGVIHGWQTNHLLMYRGVLYAGGRVDDPSAQNTWKCSGAYFRRKPGGKWERIAAVPQPTYMILIGPDGRVWDVTPSDYAKTEILHMRRPLYFGRFEMPYCGTNAYLGASVSPEGNFLVMHAEVPEMEAFKPNAIVAAFYEQATGKWHKSRFVTPEGRYGYIGIILRGRKALAVLNSALADPKAVPEPPHYSWRHVRLARCDDLTRGEWTNKGFLMPEYGDTTLQDLIEGPDGSAYLSYGYRGGSTLEDARSRPMLHYIARIKDDLSTHVFATGINASATRILVSRKGDWYLVGRASDGDLHLWDLRHFKPVKEYDLPATDKLEGYMIHTLDPDRFGGEDDGDTIHVVSARYVNDKGEKPAAGEKATKAELWWARFELPAASR